MNTEAAYRRYLKTYPDGAHVAEARDRFREIRANAENKAWEEAEAADTVAAYDEYLDRFPTGPRAEDARRRHATLKRQEDKLARNDAQRAEEEAWADAQAADTRKAYRAFLQAYPDSRYAAEAEARRNELIKAARIRREKALKLNRASWESIEQRLAFLGFDPGKQDGKIRKATRRAVAQYRRSRGLPVHSYVDKRFIDVLVDETNKPRKASGADLLNQIFKSLQ